MNRSVARWKERFWPTINDLESARLAVQRAIRITAIWAIVNLVIGLISLFSGSQITEGNFENGGKVIPGVTFVVTGLLFALIAWRIRNMSRGWTLGGLILASFMLLSDFAASPSPIALVFHLIVLIYFVNALRAAFAFERLEAAANSSAVP